MLLQGEELRNVSFRYFKDIKYENLTKNELFDLINNMKSCGLSYEAKQILDFAIFAFVEDKKFIQLLLPIYTSCCRDMNQPQKAIEMAERFLPICDGSHLLYTSLAAAYCDIQDYENAIRNAKIAYKKQGGAKNYQTELSLLFKRLRKEAGEDFADELADYFNDL